MTSSITSKLFPKKNPFEFLGIPLISEKYISLCTTLDLDHKLVSNSPFLRLCKLRNFTFTHRIYSHTRLMEGSEKKKFSTCTLIKYAKITFYFYDNEFQVNTEAHSDFRAFLCCLVRKKIPKHLHFSHSLTHSLSSSNANSGKRKKISANRDEEKRSQAATISFHNT